MFLIYINELGPNYKGQNIYEFIFGNELKDVWGADWESEPANGNPTPPNTDLVKKVGVIKKDGLAFELSQNSDFFSMSDAMDKIIALGWESLDEKEIEESRLVFHFGESIESIENKLYDREIVLDYKQNLDFSYE